MTWYVGVFKKTVGDESMVRRLSTVGIDSDFIRETWSLPEDDPVFGAAYNIDEDELDKIQCHVAEKISLESYTYQLFDEYD